MVTENTSVQQGSNFHSSSWIHSCTSSQPSCTYDGADRRWIEVLYSSLHGTPPYSGQSWWPHIGDGSTPKCEESGPWICSKKALPEHLITPWSEQEITFTSQWFNHKTIPVLKKLIAYLKTIVKMTQQSMGKVYEWILLLSSPSLQSLPKCSQKRFWKEYSELIENYHLCASLSNVIWFQNPSPPTPPTHTQL